MKKLLIAVSLLTIASAPLFAQKAMTRTGKITFDATTPTSPEKISGIDKQVACAMDAKTGHIQFQSQIKDFKFEKALMEDHFNENYMESKNFPKASFDGNITNIADVNLSKDGTYTATATGKLDIHGTTNPVTTTGTIKVSGGKITVIAKFSVKLADYKIVIPTVVADKIAKEATISLDAELIQK